jgi:hypothetical protein
MVYLKSHRLVSFPTSSIIPCCCGPPVEPYSNGQHIYIYIYIFCLNKILKHISTAAVNHTISAIKFGYLSIFEYVTVQTGKYLLTFRAVSILSEGDSTTRQ